MRLHPLTPSPSKGRGGTRLQPLRKRLTDGRDDILRLGEHHAVFKTKRPYAMLRKQIFIPTHIITLPVRSEVLRPVEFHTQTGRRALKIHHVWTNAELAAKQSVRDLPAFQQTPQRGFRGRSVRAEFPAKVFPVRMVILMILRFHICFWFFFGFTSFIRLRLLVDKGGLKIAIHTPPSASLSLRSHLP